MKSWKHKKTMDIFSFSHSDNHQEILHHIDQQKKNIQEAIKRWRHVHCSATNATIFISPHLLLFDSLFQVEEFIKYSTGLTCGLDYLANLLQQLPVHLVGTKRQFSELCSKLIRYVPQHSSRLVEFDEFLNNNKVRFYLKP